MTINPDRLFKTVKTLDIFVNNCLDLQPKGPHLSGFEYNRDLLKASMANTYLETVSNRADSLHLAIKKAHYSNFYWAYLNTVKVLSRRIKLNELEVVVAMDYTTEDFYGDVEGFWVHGWTGKAGITGKFKFLTCALICSKKQIKTPLISIPIRLGHNMAKEVTFCLSIIQPFVKKIKLVLFDRGFYSKELMYTLTNSSFPYLIFVPKNDVIKRELSELQDSEKKIINHPFEFYMNKTKYRGNTNLAILKKMLDPSNGKEFDWSFATNLEHADLDNIISIYKKRWSIETGFRVQDEARIKSKTKNMKTRYFYFVYEQMLQLLWACLFKNEMTFKSFIIEMYEMSNQRVTRAEEKAKRANP